MFAGVHTVVTGGSSGIGHATACALAKRGAHVAIIARNPGRLEEAVCALERHRVDARQLLIARSADLSVWEQACGVFGGLAAEGFSPKLLVNSAGVIVPGEFTAMSLDDFERNFSAGFWSVVHACKAVVPEMVAVKAGHIVNVSSVAGFLGIYGYTGYAAAKYATLGFSEALRCELRPHGISVAAVLPPDTDTPGLAYEIALRPPETDAIASAIRPIEPERVARAILSGVERRRFHIIPDLTSSAYFRLKGLLPELFYAVIDSAVDRARRR